MIKKFLIGGLFLMFTHHLLIGQTYSEFSYQSPYGDQEGLKIIPSLDGGFVIIGIAYYSIADPFDSHAAKDLYCCSTSIQILHDYTCFLKPVFKAR